MLEVAVDAGTSPLATSLEPGSSSNTRRPIFGLSSAVMVVLVVVPTLRVCGSPTMPAEFPPAYFIHAGSILAAIAAFTVARRLRKVALTSLATMWMTAFAALGLCVADSAGGWVAVSVAALGALSVLVPATMAMMRRKDLGERAFAYLLAGHALVCLGWYALLALDPEAMYGADLGLGVAIVMVLAAAFGVIQLEVTALDLRRAAAARLPGKLPRARVV